MQEVQHSRQPGDDAGELLRRLDRPATRDGRDPPDALRDALLRDDPEGTRLTRPRQVRPAAELDGVAHRRLVGRVRADEDDAHRVGVLLAEDRAKAGQFLRGGQRHDGRADGEVGVDLLVDESLDVGDLLAREGLRVRVEVRSRVFSASTSEPFWST